MTDEKVKSETKESAQYDNFLGKTEIQTTPLVEFMDGDVSELELGKEKREWEEHWQGMPEYRNEDNPCYKILKIRFASEEDYQDFAKKIEQNLTEKTKSIWHPALDKQANSRLRWIFDEEEANESAS